MATASSSGLSSLGRKKKAPGLMDQIGNFFGGDKKRKSKGSFRGLSSPVRPAKAAPKGGENAVVRLFRTIVSPAPPKSRWTAMTAKLGQKSTGSAKAKKAGAGDSGTLSKIFKMGTSRTGSLPKK
ncbi:myelin basic protein isoform X1 [Oncorhynchus tshawytscha]|uniref:Myelin basic protein n=3 Tax=Salmoninae TaxID=504568 RepID=A0A8C7HV01_ONCKI|nr:myelin basic protein isoform X1 [Oncorhynchus tshawytscha]XP_029484556.1 myelin basic protein-like isoform X1 [Oncorhynchus nerka]XP_031647926.1 myelin basic protein isoform X2 [Oncorhynchus kisutch]XP_031647929.1 myelin basic protein isoform X2 [Oncorhynchus kisutch]XP_046169781.1 myelin basic protein-like isoform X1 [Oncorhynchus gorbuscha]